MARLPFVRLNLRHNPFGEAAEEERGDLFVGGLNDWPLFLGGAPVLGNGAERGSGSVDDRGGRVTESRRFLQFLGPSGCGKSAYLLALRDRFPGAHLLAWNSVEGWPELSASGNHPLFVDDAQELDGPLLDRVLRFHAVAVATQKDLAVSFRKAEFLVRTVRVPDRVSFSLLQEMVTRRLEWARRGPGPLPSVGVELLRSLLARHCYDLRAIQSHLYDWCQQLEAGE
jgi:hypothetical protein